MIRVEGAWGAEREQLYEMGVSERAGWQYSLVNRGSRNVQFEDYYTYIYILN